MHLANPEDLDPFIALRSFVRVPCPRPEAQRAPSLIKESPSPSGDEQRIGSPKQNKRKRELASLMADASFILDCHSINKIPCKENLPEILKASPSRKKVEKLLSKPKAITWSKTTVKVVEESQAAKGKVRQMEVRDVEESETEEVPPPLKRLKSSKSAPAPSKTSNFRPALLIDDQGRLKLPGDSVKGFTPFKHIEHAQLSFHFTLNYLI
ncbi:hypothetical protein GG344DRAFT_84239 [Lentinula edodes]|nr:hypothetical protein GG344DRAFT_84239 [Lentinula edodes]